MADPFTLASVIIDGAPRPAVGLKDEYVLFPDTISARYPSLKAVLEDWPAAFETVKTFANDMASSTDLTRIPAAQAQLDLPIRFPNKVIAAGANYKDHLTEMGLPVTRMEPIPVYLMPPTTALVGPGRTVKKPKMTEQFDWEIELVMVVGKRMSEVDRAEAWEGVAGFTVGLDMSARDLAKAGPPPFDIDLFRGKGQDTMAPVGPVILPRDFVADPRDMEMKLYVNGRLMQDSSTRHMIYTLDEIVSELSRFVTLEPGDLIFTGTPTGVGAHHGVFLKSGDRISAKIGDIGPLEVEVM